MEPQTNKQGGENEAKQTAQKPLPERKIVLPAKPAESKPATQQAGNKPESGKQRNEWRHPQVIVNMVLAFITIGIGFIYYFQLQQMKISTDASKKAADAAASAAESAKLSAEVGSAGLRLTDKSIELTQRSTELSQKNVELAQKNLDATREALGYANKANAISEKNMEVTTTPWIDVRLQEVKATKDRRLEVRFTVENHSDSSAPHVMTQTWVRGAVDTSAMGTSNMAVLPRQTISFRTELIVIGDAKATLNQINDGKIPIKILVFSDNAMGKRSSFMETFYRLRGTFTVSDQKFNPSSDEVTKLIKDMFPAPGKP